MVDMTEPDQAIIARLSSDFASIAAYLARASGDLRQLERIVGQSQPAPQAMAPMAPMPSRPDPAPSATAPPAPRPTVRVPVPTLPAPASSPVSTAPRADGWVGKALAVAGVAVTLVGVVLLLVLAAQAGILRPEIRVGAGAVLAAGLVGAGRWLVTRPGGRVGAIALAATGIAAGYIDVIALTTIYGWVSAPVGLAVASAVAATGLLLARRWNSEQLGLLVLVPLIGLAPVVVGGITVLLVAFMLALSAASLPVQLGKDWLTLHGARITAATLPLLVALAVSSARHSTALALACVVAAVLSIGGALISLRHIENSVAVALLGAVGTLPVLAASAAVGRVPAALLAAGLAAALLAIVVAAGRAGVLPARVRMIWSLLAAVSALVAVTVAFDGPVAGPVLLAMAVVVARGDQVARWCATGFGVVGGLIYLAYAPPTVLVGASVSSAPVATSTLVASLLLVVWVVLSAWSLGTDWSWVTAGVIGLYAVTTFTVTAGVLIGGEVQGFFAGHVVATICWVALAAIVFRYAASAPKAKRSLPIGAGAALVAAAMAKLFLFDLGTLDGIFRVVVFIVVGLALLGMGAGYARLLSQQDELEHARR